MKVVAPVRPVETRFQWLRIPTDEERKQARWFIDGSLFDEKRRLGRRTGFGLVLVTPDGNLVGYGYGTPPRGESRRLPKFRSRIELLSMSSGREPNFEKKYGH